MIWRWWHNKSKDNGLKKVLSEATKELLKEELQRKKKSKVKNRKEVRNGRNGKVS